MRRIEQALAGDWELVIEFADRILDPPPEDEEVGAASSTVVYLSDFLDHSKPVVDQLLKVFGIPTDKSTVSDYYVALQSSNTADEKFIKFVIDNPSDNSLGPDLIITIDRKEPFSSHFISTGHELNPVDFEDENPAGQLIDRFNSDSAMSIRAKLVSRLLACFSDTLNHDYRRVNVKQVTHLLAG